MTGSAGTSRRHARNQVAVALGLAGTALLVLAVVPGLAPGAPPPPTRAVDSAPQPASAVDAPVASAAGTSASTARPSGPSDSTPAGAGVASPSPVPGTAAVPASPVAVEIPDIGVVSDLVGLDLDDDRRLEVPAEPDLAGWYVRGSRPGEDGPAVIAGHVDSTRGPAVFWRLADLRAGDPVRVHRADGTVVTFAVDHVGRWPKSDFPTDLVYRLADGPELRLITCGGTFDDRMRRYVDNVVVFASIVDGAGRPLR